MLMALKSNTRNMGGIMQFRELKTDVELELYRHSIATHIDVLLPLEYLKQGRVYGYFNHQKEICGGFAMITKGPFRVLNSIPNFEGLSIDPTLKHTCEITGVWLSNSNRPKFSSIRFWMNILMKILISRKKYFVYAYSTRKSGLCKIYSRANPIVLFRGETTMLPGMPCPDHESIEVVLRRRIIVQALKNPDFFIKRLIPKLNRKKSLGLKDNYEIKTAMDSLEPSLAPLFTTNLELRAARESKINN